LRGNARSDLVAHPPAQARRSAASADLIKVDEATHAEIVERIASRVAELVADAGLESGLRHVSTARLARLLDLSEDWVRDHAAELGAVRAGGGRNGELRFEVVRVRTALDARRLEPPPTRRAATRPGPQRDRNDVELLSMPVKRRGPTRPARKRALT
jgi:hypothetical protein